MEKKNTMLLTVIAVATLLVAVVGATFAYFSLTVGGSYEKTTATVTTEKVALISLTNPSKVLTLKVTADDMLKEQHGTYYALAGNDLNGKDTATSVWSNEEKTYDIATIKREGGETGATYTCAYKLKINPTGFNAIDYKDDAQNTVKNAAVNDIVLTITGDDNSGENITSLGSTYNLTQLSSTIADVDGTFTLKADQATSTIKASLKLVNDENRAQNFLAGHTFGIELEIGMVGDCEIAAGE